MRWCRIGTIRLRIWTTLHSVHSICVLHSCSMEFQSGPVLRQLTDRPNEIFPYVEHQIDQQQNRSRKKLKDHFFPHSFGYVVLVR